MKKAIGFSVIICIFICVDAGVCQRSHAVAAGIGEDSDIEQFMGGRVAANAVMEAQDFYHIFTAAGNDLMFQLTFPCLM